jgi:hypothetical protein
MGRFSFAPYGEPMKRILIALAATLLCAFALAQSRILPITVTPSATALTSATFTTSDMTNAEWQGAHIVINATALSGGTLTPKIQGKDPASGAYYTVLTGAAISGAGTSVLRVYPSLTPTTNTVADLLPRTWRLQITSSSSPVGTATIGGFLFP